MPQQAIILPVLCLVALTFIVWNVMYVQRVSYMRRHRIHPQRVKNRVRARVELQAVAGAADNLQNLLEMPVLFYLLAVLVYVTERVDAVYVLLAWAFVALRIVHSLIHVTYNRVMHRFLSFIAGCLVLWLMWARFAVQVL